MLFYASAPYSAGAAVPAMVEGDLHTRPLVFAHYWGREQGNKVWERLDHKTEHQEGVVNKSYSQCGLSCIAVQCEVCPCMVCIKKTCFAIIDLYALLDMDKSCWIAAV